MKRSTPRVPHATPRQRGAPLRLSALSVPPWVHAACVICRRARVAVVVVLPSTLGRTSGTGVAARSSHLPATATTNEVAIARARVTASDARGPARHARTSRRHRGERARPSVVRHARWCDHPRVVSIAARASCWKGVFVARDALAHAFFASISRCESSPCAIASAARTIFEPQNHWSAVMPRCETAQK